MDAKAIRLGGSEAATTIELPARDPEHLGIDVLVALFIAADGLVILDRHLRCVLANPAACTLLGYAADRLRGRDFLNPAHVNGVVDVVLAIDIGGLNGYGDFEDFARRLGVHSCLEWSVFNLPPLSRQEENVQRPTFNVQRPMERVARRRCEGSSEGVRENDRISK